MSNRTQIATRASLIEQLMSKRNFEDIGNHLTELETLHVTREHLQQTDVVRAVYRVLKNCPSVALKKKAKCLLSEWKALYEASHFHPRDSPKFFPSGGSEGHVGRSPDASQDAVPGGSSSHSRLSTDVTAQATKRIVPEASPGQMEPKEERVRGGDPQSADKRPSELLDPAVPLRAKCTELLYEALTSSSMDQPKADLWQNFAREIEEHIFALYSKNPKKYKTCIRSKVANLKNPQNSHLRQNLLSGTTSPREFAEMTVMEMASEELKQLRASYADAGLREHRLPHAAAGTQTTQIRCRRCEQFRCSVTVIARGALFLPGWVRNSNPDEEMMTYVICNECGEQWYHSNWVCL